MLKVANSVISASQITGVLPVVNGGTGVTTSTGTGNTVLSASPTLSGDVTLSTGNLIPNTAAKGINFTANTPAAGMTTQLLGWYEQGTWTPSIGGTATYTLQSGTYTRIGRMVFVSAVLQINVIGTGNVNTISGLPFTRDANSMQAPGSMTFISAISSSVSLLVPVVQVNTSTVIFQGLTIPGNTTSQINVFQNSARVDFQVIYQT